MIVLIVLQTAAVIAPEPTAGAMLWRDFRVGMKPEQVAESVKAIEGINSAIVKRGRNGQFKALELKYKDKTILVGDTPMTLEPAFVGESLSEINLRSTACLSAGMEKMKQLRDTLTAKYGKFAVESVVDGNGVEFQKRAAFWNDETRVRLSFEVQTPSLQYYPSAGNSLQRSLSNLANAMSQQAYDIAIAACPADRGATLTTTVNYSAQARFVIEHDAAAKAREQKAKALKDAL